MKALLLTCLLSLSLVANSQTTATPDVTGVAARRAAHLRHGINTSAWFAQAWGPKAYTKEYLETHTTAQDISLIKQMGFDHIRLSVNPQPMWARGHSDEIPAEYLGYLDNAVHMILDQGLAVIIDIHPESDFKARLAKEDGFVEAFADYWRGLANHYSNLDADRVFFEILNEPEISDPYRWYGIQAKLAAAIREGAPKHTIIAAGAKYSDDDDLLFMEPLRDSNVIYNFHYYYPHIFTHQGATWGADYWHHEEGLAYPSNRESAQKVASAMPEANNALQVIRYGLDHWDAERIDGEITMAAKWAKRYNVPLTCNEFGVYRKVSDPQDRARWISDVRTSLEKHGIGWSMWDYSGGFGVVTKGEGKPAIPDDVTLKALGLK